ncbi:sporulation integral membrane protein YtvI [Bacillus spongiae]|uniref:Sporulation integral membrane protein YtvI n=1 Tax=Bacillus spongiae TaxID=2683610 RepID=A0ABU8H8J4_9BACI
MNIVYFHRFLRFLVVILSVILFFITAFYVSTLTYPFIFAILLAFLINPLVNILEDKARIPRPFAVFISILLLFALFVGVITLLIAEIVEGAEYLSNVLPDHIETFIQFAENSITAYVIPIYEHLASIFNNLESVQQETIIANIQAAGEEIASNAGEFLQNFFQLLPNLITWIPNTATAIIFTILATFFISKDWYRLTALIAKHVPKKAKSSGRTVYIDLKKALFGFFKAQLTLISLTMVVIFIGLLILRVKYSITIALLIGLVDLLPYLGTAAVLIPWMLYELLSGDIKLGIGLAILYMIVAIQRQIMEPKVLSSSIGLDPLATLLSLFVGFKLIGFLGLIIGPITLVMITALRKAGVFHDVWIYIKGNTPPS